jgi:hypothetical protein
MSQEAKRAAIIAAQAAREAAAAAASPVKKDARKNRPTGKALLPLSRPFQPRPPKK